MKTQRRDRRNRAPQVEGLESLTMLSGLAALAQAPAVVSAATTPLALRGSARGTFTATQANPDTGKTYHILTLGKTTAGASMAVIGDIQAPGFVANGRATGTLTVFTPRGSLTLAVRGPVQTVPSVLPNTLGYTITGGTGAFAHNHSGTGTITVAYKTAASSTLTDQSGTISLVFKGGTGVV